MYLSDLVATFWILWCSSEDEVDNEEKDVGEEKDGVKYVGRDEKEEEGKDSTREEKDVDTQVMIVNFSQYFYPWFPLTSNELKDNTKRNYLGFRSLCGFFKFLWKVFDNFFWDLQNMQNLKKNILI